MGFERELTLYCDNACGASEAYTADAIDCGGNEPDLPPGWKKNYVGEDSIFGHVCDECVKDFEEEADV